MCPSLSVECDLARLSSVGVVATALCACARSSCRCRSASRSSAGRFFSCSAYAVAAHRAPYTVHDHCEYCTTISSDCDGSSRARRRPTRCRVPSASSQHLPLPARSARRHPRHAATQRTRVVCSACASHRLSLGLLSVPLCRCVARAPTATAPHPTPSHPIPSHPISSHPIPSHAVPGHHHWRDNIVSGRAPSCSAASSPP
jgi:hypothetical protein